MINPYKGIDWGAIKQVYSSTHDHIDEDTTQSFRNEKLFSIHNFGNEQNRHINISNYVPSRPMHPLTSWFTQIPEGMIGTPGAEHTNISGAGHTVAIGSTFDSGEHASNVPNRVWTNFYQLIINDLVSPEMGGIYHAHVKRDGPGFNVLCEMLDTFDEFLGIAAYNGKDVKQGNDGWALDLWDEILSTGRRCWGFWEADASNPWNHGYNIPNATYDPVGTGRNIVLVSDINEENIMLSYRKGAFFGNRLASGLSFESIQENEGTIYVETNTETNIVFVSTDLYGNVNVQTTDNVTNSSIELNPNSTVYARIEAHLPDESDSVFSQPLIYMDKDAKQSFFRRRRLITTIRNNLFFE